MTAVAFFFILTVNALISAVTAALLPARKSFSYRFWMVFILSPVWAFFELARVRRLRGQQN